MEPPVSPTATLDLSTAAARAWPAVVVGAGPAGALAARELARRGVEVLLVDRSAFPRWKVCGCCLNAAALATLASVGLGGLVERCGGRHLAEVCLAARGCAARLALPGGRALSREAFDAALVREAVRAGAAFLPGTEASLGAGGSAAGAVILRQPGRQAEVTAGVVLAADGLGGRLLAGELPRRASKDTCPTRARASRIGAGVLADLGPSFYSDHVIYLACSRAGYVGLVRLEDGRLDVAAAFDRQAVRDAAGPGSAAARILAEVGWPAVPGLAELPWRGTPPLTRRAVRLAGERLFVVGDAAGYVEPFTGEGIAWALAGAVAVAPLAARAARCWQPGLAAEWEKVYRRTVARRQTLCRLVAKGLRHPHFVRGLIHLLAWLPGLAGPVLRHLNAATTSVLPALPPGHWSAGQAPRARRTITS
jgi:flavin-dependent dehydrogenase